MPVEIQLFGALRDAEPEPRLVIDARPATLGELRALVQAHADAHWPAAPRALLSRSAFASERSVLRDGDPVPADGRLALLPPVSGG